MIAKFPYSFTTVSGHKVVVSNPEKGKFCFEGLTKQGEKIDFNWYNGSYTGNETKGPATDPFEAVEHDVLHAFWQLERG